MNEEHDQYKETTRKLKQEKMDWDFEDFLEKTKTENPHRETPHPRLGNNSRNFWLAASVVILLAVGFVLKFGNSSTAADKDLLVKTEIMKEKNRLQQESQFALNKVVADSAKVKSDSLAADSATALEPVRESDIMDQILPRRGRIRKETRPRFAANDKALKTETKNTKNDIDYQSTYVIINGQKIESEQEAIDLTKYSFRILSENVSKTVAQTDVLQNYNNDY